MRAKLFKLKVKTIRSIIIVYDTVFVVYSIKERCISSFNVTIVTKSLSHRLLKFINVGSFEILKRHFKKLVIK